MGKGWSDGDELSIAEQRVKENLVVIEDAEDVDVGLSVEIIDDRSSRIQIQVTANLHGLSFQDSHETLLQTSDVVCQTCSRKDGAYFEAEFQIRSTGRRLDSQELSSIRATLDEMILDTVDDPMFFRSVLCRRSGTRGRASAHADWARSMAGACVTSDALAPSSALLGAPPVGADAARRMSGGVPTVLSAC